MLRRRFSQLVIMALATLAGLIAACGGAEEQPVRPTPGDPPSTVEVVYERMLAGMNRPRKLFHTLVEASVDQGANSYRFVTEAWIAPDRNTARLSLKVLSGPIAAGAATEGSAIIVGDALYTTTSSEETTKTRASTCRKSDSPLLSRVLGCRGALEQSNTTLQTDVRYQDHGVIALVTVGTSRSEDESSTFTDTLYVDPATYFPIAMEQSATLDTGEKSSVKGTTLFTNEFVDSDSEPADFFDPAAIGYVPKDPEEPLRVADPGVGVYWLGRDFAPGTGLPALTLNRASLHPGDLPPGYRALLSYRLAADEFGSSQIDLQEWTAPDWQAFIRQSGGGNWWDDPCIRREEVTFAGGRAVVFKGYQPGPPTAASGPDGCPMQAPDRFLAQAYLGDTVVLILVSGATVNGTFSPSSYDSFEGISAIAKGLEPRS